MGRRGDDFARIVTATIDGHRLVGPCATVVVAVSGGVDSAALLDYLAQRRDLALRIVVAHLNHCLRGDESDGDEELVREVTAGYGAAFESARVDVESMARAEGLSLEEAGREARYRFFADVASRYPGAVVALAHHRDDQAETVLLRLLRGSGPTGLRGMGYRSADGRYIRPALDAGRGEIEAYAAARGLRFRTDSSNSDTSFMRNRIRLLLLPLLKEYNPAIVSRLADTAAIMAADEEIVATGVKLCWDRVGIREDGTVSILCALLLHEPSGMRMRIFRHAVTLLSGHLRRISYRHLLAVDRLLVCGPPNGRLDLPGGVRVVRSYDTLAFIAAGAEPPLPFEMTIPGAGIYDLPGGGRVAVTPQSGGGGKGDSRCAITVDLNRVPFPWTVRSFRPGDRLIPSGMTGHKKVKALFIDEKVPRPLRCVLPLFFSGSLLFWVAGVRTSAAVDSAAEGSDRVRIELLEFPGTTAILR